MNIFIFPVLAGNEADLILRFRFINISSNQLTAED